MSGDIHAIFEPLMGVIRVFDNGKEYGDTYSWVATCRFIDKATVEVLGVMDAPKKEWWRAVLKTLGHEGVKTVCYKRYKNDEERIFKHNTR